MNVHFPRSIRKIMQVSVTKELPNTPHTNFKAFRPAEIKQDKKKCVHRHIWLISNDHPCEDFLEWVWVFLSFVQVSLYLVRCQWRGGMKYPKNSCKTLDITQRRKRRSPFSILSMSVFVKHSSLTFKSSRDQL